MLTALRPRAPRAIDRRGIASVEFALVAPILIMCVLALVDIANAVITWRRLSIAAEEIGEIATEMAAQPGGTNAITSTQVWQAMSAAFAVLPNWKTNLVLDQNGNAVNPPFGITTSSIVYQATPANCAPTACSYQPTVAWSTSFVPGIVKTRPCGTQTQVANTAANAMTQLPLGVATASYASELGSNANPPAGTTGPSPLLVVDVMYTFQPIFYKFITGPISMLRTAYFVPRIGTNAQYVTYTPTGTSVTCPGF